jgi:general secretion pathway protein K
MAEGRRSEQGLALVAVVWVIALMAVMALDVLAAAGAEDRSASDRGERARMEAAADAGLALATRHLLASGPQPGSRELAEQEIAFDGTRLTLRFENEAGKVDLNAAPPVVLRALFTALEVPPAAADRLVAAVLDWRDGDDSPRQGGAEWDDYRRAGLTVRPRDGEFQSVAELRHVMGMTPELFARIQPSVTVHSRRAEVDRAAASPLVARVGSGSGGGVPRLAPPSARPSDASAAGGVFRITVTAERPGGRFVRSAVVRLTGNPADPYWVQEW